MEFKTKKQQRAEAELARKLYRQEQEDAPSYFCKAPDRHEPRLRCGHPLPCPHHTVAVVIEGEGTPC